MGGVRTCRSAHRRAGSRLVSSLWAGKGGVPQVSGRRGRVGAPLLPTSHASGFQQLQQGCPRHCRALGWLGWGAAARTTSVSSPGQGSPGLGPRLGLLSPARRGVPGGAGAGSPVWGGWRGERGAQCAGRTACRPSRDRSPRTVQACGRAETPFPSAAEFGFCFFLIWVQAESGLLFLSQIADKPRGTGLSRH